MGCSVTSIFKMMEVPPQQSTVCDNDCFSPGFLIERPSTIAINSSSPRKLAPGGNDRTDIVSSIVRSADGDLSHGQLTFQRLTSSFHIHVHS